MIGTLDLLGHRYALSQLPLLTGKRFGAEARARGSFLDERLLSELHRLRLLVPLYRVRRDGRAIRAAYRRSDHDGYAEAHFTWSAASDLVELRGRGRLTDPADEGFTAPRRLRRGSEDQRYDSSYYLYSAHQVIALPLVARLLPGLRWEGRGDDARLRFDADASLRRIYCEQALRARELAIASALLEPVYYSRIVGRLRLPAAEDFEPFLDWRRGLDPQTVLGWLADGADWVRTAAEELLSTADRVDPLGAFAEVIARADPDRWRSLRRGRRSICE
jgi:hypothetical protein